MHFMFQNIAVKEESRRVEVIMNDKAAQLVEKSRLEGQRRLEDALAEARKNFDKEKEEAIKETVRKLQKDFDQQLREEQQGNKRDVEKLNNEWKDKIKVSYTTLYHFVRDFLVSNAF